MTLSKFQALANILPAIHAKGSANIYLDFLQAGKGFKKDLNLSDHTDQWLGYAEV